MIQSILRHTDSSTTADIYLHPSTDEQRAALNLIADALDHAGHRGPHGPDRDQDGDIDGGGSGAVTAA